MTQLERFSIVWKQADDQLAQRFYVPGYRGFLPFLISGPDVDLLENQVGIELNEGQLLEGILYGLYEFDHEPKPWHTAEDRDTLIYLLDVLSKGFNVESPEKLILDIAFRLRERNGNHCSRRIVLLGMRTKKRSSKCCISTSRV